MRKTINSMDLIAHQYAVELNKLFIILDEDKNTTVIYPGCRYKFTEKGLLDEYDGEGYESVMSQILVGNLTIEKEPEFAKPFQAEDNEEYWYIDERGSLFRSFFIKCDTDYYRMKAGNMFKKEDKIPKEQILQIVKEMKGE